MAINRYAAIAWIYSNQLGRRNLTNEQKHYLIGKQYEAQKAAAAGAPTNNQNAKKQSVDNIRIVPAKEADKSKSHNPMAEKVGKEHGVSDFTVKQDEKFAKGVDEAEKLSSVFLKLRFQKYGACYFPK